MNELTQIIEKLVTEQTFSLEAVKAIEILKIKSIDLETNLKNKIKQIDSLNIAIINKADEITNLKKELESLNKRLTDIVTRENAVTLNEKLTAVAQAQSAAYVHAFEIVFKPNTVRQTLIENIPIVQQYTGGGGSYVTQHQQSKITTNEEGV